MTYVCITGNEQSAASLEQRIERVLASHARVLCELRLDYLDMNPAAAFSFLARLPAEMAPRLVLTQRLRASGPHAGGGCGWDVLTWQSWWRDVMALRPWFAVDIDWIVLDRLAGESLAWRGGRFRSRHAFFSLHGTLDELESEALNLAASAREHGVGVKLACPVERADELLRLAELSGRVECAGLKTVVAMGAAGKAWRWSPLAGSLTYFAADAGRATAPGQEEMAAVLPYLATRQRPELFLLLGDNPGNHYGEARWNRAFQRRGARARYVNVATSDAPGSVWAEKMQGWMTLAQIRGASVTKPYKLSFGKLPVNTLLRTGDGWRLFNTDGEAVKLLLERSGVKAGARVLIAGGGGAARAGEESLKEAGYACSLWVRAAGRLGPRPHAEALVSTWPGEYQEALVEALASAPHADLQLVVDAQFTRDTSESPLARWAAGVGIPYVSGEAWWREQARRQDRIWFGEDRLGAARAQLLSLVPASKSETLRALAIAAALGLPSEIRGPARNEDAHCFSAALERLGVSVDHDGDCWRVFPAERLLAPGEPIAMGEGATGFRLMGALSALMEGTLLLGGARRLSERPQQELLEAFGLRRAGWPLEIPCGLPLPLQVSMERSSQFASGFLIAAAGLIARGKREEYRLALAGECRSMPYLELTLQMLREAGFSALLEDGAIVLRQVERLRKLNFTIGKDASSLAFLEVYARRFELRSFFEGSSRQGDAAFPRLLDSLLAGESTVDLGRHPDLAPPLWSAAALFRRQLEVRNCPQLHHKESDRAVLLADAARRLGAFGEPRADGFRVDFSAYRGPRGECFLRTDGDHRIAMAAALLGVQDPHVSPDRRDCVGKSFPEFWQALALLEEALPG